MKIPLIQENETYQFGEKLQSRELNIVLRTTETACQTCRYGFEEGCFRKSAV